MQEHTFAPSAFYLQEEIIHTFEDGLGIIHYCRLGDLLRVVCDFSWRLGLELNLASDRTSITQTRGLD